MAPTPQVSHRDLRQLIQKLLRTDSDQDAFVLDYFHEVYRLFAAGMDRTQKITLLLDRRELDEVLQALRQQYPKEVSKFLADRGSPELRPGPMTTTPPSPSSEPAPARGGPLMVCLFPSDSNYDRAAYLELRKHLAPKLRAGSLSIWSPADALPGEQLQQVRDRHLQDAAVVALLVSPEFLADSELDEVIKQVLRRRAEGRCVVVPVLISAADWKSSRFGSLQPLPRDGVPLRLRKDRDSAWVEVVEGLAQALQYRPQREEPIVETPRPQVPFVQPPGSRVAPVVPPPAAPRVSMGAPLVPPMLGQALERGAVVPFAGAGVSRAVTSRATDLPLFPDWGELLHGAAERLKRSGKEGYARAVSGLVDIGESDSFLEAARRAQQGLGPDWFRYLREVLDPPSSKVKPESLALAQALWTLGSKLIITTNYDQVLRWACPDSLRQDQQTWDISAAAEFAAMLSGGLERATIWHLHGYVGNLANVILTPDGYQRLYPDSALIKSAYEASLLTLRTVLSSRTLLFVGFSFTDAALREQVRFLDEAFRGTVGPHYMMVEQSKLELAREQLRGLPSIEPLPFASRETLPAELHRLAALQRS